MAERPPWLDYQAPQGVTVPLGPRDPYKATAEARAQRADARAAAADRRAQADFDSKNTMVPPPGDTSKTGDEYLATIPTSLAGQVKALSDGRRAFPTGAALRSPSVQELIAAATQYDPTLDAANASTRVATRKKFTSGTTRDNITAINTALGHLGTLWKDAQGLDNRGLPIWNSIANAAESATGDPRVTKFNLTRHAVTDELEKAFRGSGGTQTGIEEWSKAINSSQSPEQLRGAVGKAVELLSSRLGALNDAYAQGMGHSADPMTFLNPHARQVFNALGPGGDGNVPDTPKDMGGAPPILGGGSPPSGPGMTPATGDTKDEITRTPTDKKIAAMLNAGASSANIRAVAGKDYPGLNGILAWRALHPGVKGYDVYGNKVVPTTLLNRAVASPLAAGIMAGGDAASAGLSDEAIGAVKALQNGGSLADNIASTDLAKQTLANANPGASLVGNVLGGTAAMLGGGAALKGLGIGKAGWLAANPIKAAALGDMAYGGAYGAGENNDNRLLGAAVGAPVGALGSLGGSALAKGVGAGLRGVVNPAVDRLRAAGIPLTVGEVLGGGWKKAQDAMTSVFGPGNMVARRYADGRRAMNEAAFNAAGQVIDTPINAVGQEGIDLLDQAKSQAYSDALDPVSLNLNTPHFSSEIDAAINAAKAIPNADQASDIATGAINNYIGKPVMASDGVISGQDFQQGYRGLSQTAGKSGARIFGHEINGVLNRTKDALVTELEQQNPGAYEGFVKANSANRHLNILANAVNAAKNQVDSGEQLFTPAQLGSAATANAKSYGGNIAAASGNRPFNQLATDAQQVMSSKLPESGTAPRLAMLAGLSAAGGGTGYGSGGGEGAVEGAAIPAVALSLLGTKRGQQLLTAALLKRVAPFRKAGTAIGNNPQIGGDVLASLGIPLLAGP